ncbi:MAG: glycosyltransferase family 4 protein [Limimaricola soesokkakensis]|uniref:glycosyltransferase family 4 protein n=1 Tax=Limimaricola soesokkakensis TaxID=1343159 RepID=UPI004059C975
MRILIPVLGFDAHGGYRVLSELANAWIRLGHDCTFLAPATSPEPYFPTTAPILRSDKRGRFERAVGPRRASGLDNLASLAAGLNRIGEDYDVIFANHSLTAWPVRWCRAGQARKFYYVQAYEPGYYPLHKKPLKHAMARLSYFFDLTQISNSGAYSGAGLKPKEIIPPGIDLSIFTPKADPGSFGAKDYVALGTIGRTEPHKGTTTALAAYRKLRHEGRALRMNVAFGNVEPAPDLAVTQIRGDAALAAYYRSLDVLIVSCTGQHGAPHYPLIEAMASGTPVVHTGYFPGNAANSWPATDASAEAVAAAIRQVLDATPQERRTRTAAAREMISETLGWEAVASSFLKHFDA